VTALTATPTDLGSGVALIDAEFTRSENTGSYLVRGRDTAAFVEVGTALSTPRLLEALDTLGVARADVGYVIVTHVHLDHAGGAGTLMQALPNARLVVHPRGRRHMVDPTQLIAGATQVYGEALMKKNYGVVLPVPTERIIETTDGFALDLGDRPLRFLDAPGHAKHNVAVFDVVSRGVFTGDTFGLSYPGLGRGRRRFIFPTTSPVQFDPAALHSSIERILALEPARIYLTHYGLLDGDLKEYAAHMHRIIDVHVEAARAVGPGPDAPARLAAKLVDVLAAELKLQGVEQSRAQAMVLWNTDLEVNAQGLAVWLAKVAG
jgi:glyoxylase-like metal-dependent hydrolase (beta-lactamase superfamily II)